jgi:hypothetical protein
MAVVEPTPPAAPPGAAPLPPSYAQPGPPHAAPGPPYAGPGVPYAGPGVPYAAPPPVAARRRSPRASAWALRVALTLLALGCVAQPLLIGRYLDGDYGAVGEHGANGIFLLFLTMAAGVAAAVWWICGGHPLPLVTLVGVWFVMGFQLGMGYSRNLSIHIPLGVGIVTAALVAAGWSWTGRVFRRVP